MAAADNETPEKTPYDKGLSTGYIIAGISTIVLVLLKLLTGGAVGATFALAAGAGLVICGLMERYAGKRANFWITTACVVIFVGWHAYKLLQ
jgi:hypothetical protein